MDHGSSSGDSFVLRLVIFLNVLKRRTFVRMNFRFKILFCFSIFLFFAWMQLGSFRKEDLGSNDITAGGAAAASKSKVVSKEILPKGGKVKEYPDFDYKYDLKKPKKPSFDQVDFDELPLQRNKKKRKPSSGNSPERHLTEEELKILFPPSVDDSSRLPSHDLNKMSAMASRKNLTQNFAKPARRRNSLNGVPMTENLGQFDVVGSRDLFRSESLSAGYDEFIEDDLKVVPGLGEMGAPVHLEGAEEVRAQLVMKKEAFNIVASDKISLHRKVPDTRDPLCQAQVYDQELPTASVIIIFTNEAWTPLLRTIWSVIDQTPAEYLKEIILVDDFSDKPHLKGKLERYIQKKLPSKVRLKRLPKRSGLIRARLTGAELATGDVLIFLDSHCECGQDWIEPLLQRIKDERRSFAIPIIDVIDDKTMEYYHGNGVYFQIGGFTWGGHFNWIDIPEHENERRGSSIGPTRTPTMAGGLFAVDRKYFWEIGSYDEEMDVWGGENLEMSFRVWQCGGILENIPCSRVGHIFRSFHPYSFPGNKDTHGINTARTVEVWMEEYKRLFYMNRPDLLSTEIGSTQKRLQFKKDRQCKSFKWYLENIFPQKFILDDPDHAFAYGRVKNPKTNVCFDTLQNDEKDSYELGVYPCHNYVAASQFFSFSKKYELRREDNCAEVSVFGASEEKVRMVPCHSLGEDQEWIHTKQGRIIHKATNKCLDVGDSLGQELVAGPCKVKDSQIWYFDHYIS